jgi:hypothetical protein
MPMPSVIHSTHPIPSGWVRPPHGEATRFWYYENNDYMGTVRQAHENYDDVLDIGKWYWRVRNKDSWHGPFETAEAAMAAFRMTRHVRTTS